MTDAKITNVFIMAIGMAVALLLGLGLGVSIGERHTLEVSAESVEETPPVKSSVKQASEEVLLPESGGRTVTLLTVDGERFIVIYVPRGVTITPYKAVSRF